MVDMSIGVKEDIETKNVAVTTIDVICDMMPQVMDLLHSVVTHTEVIGTCPLQLAFHIMNVIDWMIGIITEDPRLQITTVTVQVMGAVVEVVEEVALEDLVGDLNQMTEE